jgi:hypothetical protein
MRTALLLKNAFIVDSFLLYGIMLEYCSNDILFYNSARGNKRLKFGKKRVKPTFSRKNRSKRKKSLAFFVQYNGQSKRPWGAMNCNLTVA